MSAIRVPARHPSSGSPAPAATPPPGGASAAATAAGLSATPAITSTSSTSGSSSAAAMRKMVWDATIPIAISLHEGDIPAGATRTIERIYTKLPRISYLALLLDEVRDSLLSFMLDPATLASLNPKDWWFEFQGFPLRWHWPVGLLFDYYTGNAAPTAIAPPHRPPSPSSLGLSPNRRQSSSTSVSDVYLSSASAGTGGATPLSPSSASRAAPPLPWHIKLHLTAPPLSALHYQPSIEQARSSFMSMVKEADFVRWGSTKRVTNLRKADQDQLWDGVVKHDFDLYWSVASKLTPPIVAAEASHGPPSRAPSMNLSIASTAASVAAPGGIKRTSSPAPSAASSSKFNTASSSGATARPGLTSQVNESQTSLAASLYSQSDAGASAAGVASMDSAATSMVQAAGTGGQASSTAKKEGQRGVPMRFHLPEGAPVVQQPVSPWLDDGRPATLLSVLSSLFPLLFPPAPSFSTFQPASPPLAFSVIQGIRVPLEAEVPWIGSTLGSADGWVAVCIVLLQDGERL